MNDDKLNRRLEQERRRLGLSQTAFGQLGGVSKRTQINYENGAMVPNTNYLLAIARAGANVNYILQADNNSGVDGDGMSAEEISLLKDYRHCSDKEKKAVREVTSTLGGRDGQPAA